MNEKHMLTEDNWMTVSSSSNHVCSAYFHIKNIYQHFCKQRLCFAHFFRINDGFEERIKERVYSSINTNFNASIMLNFWILFYCYLSGNSMFSNYTCHVNQSNHIYQSSIEDFRKESVLCIIKHLSLYNIKKLQILIALVWLNYFLLHFLIWSLKEMSHKFKFNYCVKYHKFNSINMSANGMIY